MGPKFWCLEVKWFEIVASPVSSRKAASEVYLRFGINLSHTTCAKAAEDDGALSKKKRRKTHRWRQVTPAENLLHPTCNMTKIPRNRRTPLPSFLNSSN